MRSPSKIQPQTRRKGASLVRKWLVISNSGNSHLEEVGKHSIMRRTGLPARDLRNLDPLLMYPSTILGRERAIVVNMEHIKTIVTATEVLILNSNDPLVVSLVSDLESRVFKSLGIDGAKEDGPKVLPFEFKALEVCLESACKRFETETTALEQETYPALDELTSKISTLNLERVKNIKSRLIALFGRVQKVRDELKNLLDDDMDMAEMYLTDKLVFQQSEEISFKDSLDNHVSNSDDGSNDEIKSSKSNRMNMTGYKPNIVELEMLLEAYFVQTEGTSNKLSTLREFVESTEDYINIMLNDKQNQLLEMGVLLSTANLILNAGIIVTGIFGMNIHINIFDSPSYSQFWTITSGIVGACVALYIIAIHAGKKGRLLGWHCFVKFQPAFLH